MKQIAAPLIVLMLALGPATAQDQPAPPPAAGDVEEGMNLLSEGTKLLLRGLLGEVEPAMRELQDALGNLNAYHAPEILPNGDIIIRRKTPAELVTPDEGDIEI
ncbi:AAA+ family ATPase [Pseudogemmobacter sp. W21_MBD1_M6]|uniref:AAA+ family ATPase n=1 Tax=Pseudogemmobacter sp. W21_MBD1_M6 TaxID=3240271 RepID=UPI003F97B27D